MENLNRETAVPSVMAELDNSPRGTLDKLWDNGYTSNLVFICDYSNTKEQELI